MAKIMTDVLESFAEAIGCTLCRDGWFSRSIGKGTCSWHKGIFRIFR
jgi:hypothetical protein